MPELTIPHNHKPRWYQEDFWKAFDSGLYNRFVQVWHRRSGKDITDLNLVIREALREPQIITYVFPTLVMGRQILWEGMDNEGNKFIEHYVPKEVLAKEPNDSRMTINFKNGSIFRVGGSDKPDSLRGGNTKLFILSEWSEQDPYTWTVIRPILLANKGKVVFNYTPKGDNHAKRTAEIAQTEASWWFQKLTVDDTKLFTPEELAQELRELIKEYGDVEGRAKYEQEYMCSFEAPVVGSYYGEQMIKAASSNRIGPVPYDTSYPVHTAWDIGIGDSTAIWFYQQSGTSVRLIDYYASSGVGVEHYAEVMKGTVEGYERMKEYVYERHYAPFDIENQDWSTGKTRLEVAQNYGINFRVVPKVSKEEGIQAVRNLLSRCYFDLANCEDGIASLKNYQKEWDEKNKVYRAYPKHDWSSHGADAFRYLAMSITDGPKGEYTPYHADRVKQTYRGYRP